MIQGLIGTFLVIIAAAFFALIAVSAKYAYAEGATPDTLLAVRFGVAAVGFWAYLLLRGRAVYLGVRRSLRFFAVGGGLYGSMSIFLFASLSRIPASLAIMLLYAYPVIVALLSPLFVGETMTRQKLVALALSIVGMALILAQPVGDLDVLGILLGLGSALAYAFYVMFGSKLLANVAEDVGFAYLMLSTAVVVTAYGTALGSLSLECSFLALVILVAVGLATIIAVAAFFTGMRSIGATRASIAGTFEPVVVVVLSVVLLGEMMTSWQVVGILLVIFGVLVLQWRPESVLQHE